MILFTVLSNTKFSNLLHVKKESTILFKTDNFAKKNYSVAFATACIVGIKGTKIQNEVPRN